MACDKPKNAPKAKPKKPAVPIARGKYGGNTPGGKPK